MRKNPKQASHKILRDIKYSMVWVKPIRGKLQGGFDSNYNYRVIEHSKMDGYEVSNPRWLVRLINEGRK